MSVGCKKCGECCRYTGVIVSGPMGPEAVRWAGYHGHIMVKKDENTFVVFIPNRCSKLTEEGLCSIYEDRPAMCVRIPHANTKTFQPPGCRYFDEDSSE